MIKISCDCKTMLPIEEIENFQGELKSIDLTNLNKLKSSIEQYGFSFPIFVWQKKILDGHQRLLAVRSMLEDGEELDGDLLPVVEIEAADEREAAEKLLLINSRYAKINQSGFDEFIAKFRVNMEKFGGMLEIPEIDLKRIQINDDKNDDETIIEKDGLEYKVLIECSSEGEQTQIIEKIEEMGIECKPLIL